MAKDSNEDGNIDEILAELKNETSEELSIPKKEKTKDEITTETHEYDNHDTDNDTEW